MGLDSDLENLETEIDLMTNYFRTSLLVLALALAACGSDNPKDTAGASAADTAAAQQAGNAGMQGMEGMQGGGMTERIQGHMRMMEGAGAEQMKAMMPEHRQMAANMIAEFNREMKGMNMAGDAAWNATVDSVRQDLVRMPEMPAQELAGYMPAHEGRLNRLMEMHRSMMVNMKM